MNKSTIIAVLAIAVVCLGIFVAALQSGPRINVSGVINYLDVSSANITHSTTTVNTTSTQVFSSISKMGQIVNATANQITCSLDATGTTAASSTIAAGRGIILAPAYLSTSTGVSSAMFGECYPGSINCYPHKGAVNCLAEAASVVTKWSK